MQVTSTQSTSSPPNLATKPLDPHPQDEAPCASCATGSSSHVYGEDPDGFALCRDCGALLFYYCDIGGQG